MRNAIVCCLLLQLFRPGGTALAQGYDAHWIFGDGYHIEFVDGEPQVLPYVEGYYGKEGASCIPIPAALCFFIAIPRRYGTGILSY